MARKDRDFPASRDYSNLMSFLAEGGDIHTLRVVSNKSKGPKTLSFRTGQGTVLVPNVSGPITDENAGDLLDSLEILTGFTPPPKKG